jgi:thiol-disulfide isomerase/thioredoxin
MKLKLYFVLIILLTIIFSNNINVNAQAERKVLFEKWTSSTCGPCASQNPYWHQWANQYWDTITTVAYHVGWPNSPPLDPMYLHNPTQSYDRRYYYGVNAVPCAWVDGVINTGGCAGCSYSNTPTCLTAYFQQRRQVASPLSVNVVDTRVPGDSIRANVTVTILSNLPSGNYYLRVMAIERIITYTSPPGSNGETMFPDVFRHSYPTSQGTSITTTAGTYNYIFTYKRDPVWVDSMIYTLAFVQNDANKEMLNSGRPANITVTGKQTYSNEVPGNFALMQNYPNPFNPSTYIAFTVPKDVYVNLKVYDILGNEVKTLVDGNHKAGTYNIFFDGSDLASGVYLYKLTAGDYAETKKMMLIK